MIVLQKLSLKNGKVEMISKNSTTNIKAIAIMMVLFGHLVGAKKTNFNMAWESIATFGVGLFLFISGYGLYKSFESKELNGFFKNKLKSIYIPFVIATILVGGSRGFWSDRWPDLVKTVAFINLKMPVDGTMWYIYYITIWYVAFYCVFRLIKQDIFRLIALSVVSLALFNIPERFTSDYIIAIPLFRLHAFSFTIGVAVAMSKPISRNMMFILGWVMFMTFSYLFSFYFIKHEYFNHVMTTMMVGPAIIFIISALDINLKPLTFIGGLSYEIYLFEGAFRWNTFSPDKLASCVIFFLITTSCAFTLKNTLKSLTSRN